MYLFPEIEYIFSGQYSTGNRMMVDGRGVPALFPLSLMQT